MFTIHVGAIKLWTKKINEQKLLINLNSGKLDPDSSAAPRLWSSRLPPGYETTALCNCFNAFMVSSITIWKPVTNSIGELKPKLLSCETREGGGHWVVY